MSLCFIPGLWILSALIRMAAIQPGSWKQAWSLRAVDQDQQGPRDQ